MQESAIIEVEQRLDRDAVKPLLRDLDGALSGARAVVLDLGRVDAFDSAGLGAVVEGMRRARSRGREVRLRGLSDPMLEFFSLVSVERLLEPPPRPAKRLDPFSRVGAAFEPLWSAGVHVVQLAIQTARATLVEPFAGHRLRLDRIAVELDHAGNGALPIVALISFLLGLVLAMQAYVQLRVWGAEIYMADMVGVSVVTEIGPLMTAILLAARSGGSNAAQLGSMSIGEELDALRQMGVRPVPYLVVPKVLALAITTVALGLLFDVVAICGGSLFAMVVAGIPAPAYLDQTQQAVMLGDFAVGKLKCLVFGACIGVIGCGLGLRVRAGADGVARATTNAVVVSIFVIIVLDAIFVTAQRLLLS